jgi:riboflavin kinase/FMN adenylyltransferase
MQIVTDIRTVILCRPTILTIGNFDGLHRGHQALLAALCEIARGHVPTASSAMLTFSPHPLAVLRPGFPHHLLTTPEERLSLAGQLGVDIGIIQPFTGEFAALSATEFVTLLKRHLNLSRIVVGPDFALGRDRGGDLDTLRTLGTELDFEVTVILPQEVDGIPVRSSAIRRLLQDGKVADAADLLGRPYQVTGLVKMGDQRGRQIGVPTANVYPEPEILWPADGVYATRTFVRQGKTERSYISVTNIGVRPTVDGLHHRLETHLLDFPNDEETDDLYGRTVTVEFWAKLRGEKRFANLDDLVTEIKKNIAQTRAYFEAFEQ